VENKRGSHVESFLDLVLLVGGLHGVVRRRRCVSKKGEQQLEMCCVGMRTPALIDRRHDGKKILYLENQGKTKDQSEEKETKKCVRSEYPSEFDIRSPLSHFKVTNVPTSWTHPLENAVFPQWAIIFLFNQIMALHDGKRLQGDPFVRAQR